MRLSLTSRSLAPLSLILTIHPLLTLLLSPVYALRYDPAYIEWNLNQNETATNVLDYSGVWENHAFTPSPENWRFPFYTIMLDRFVNGDPTNDNANGTIYEMDDQETQLRNGGDIKGLMNSLDYLQGMGIKVCILFSSNCFTPDP